jgi:site-specific recombinase XerD
VTVAADSRQPVERHRPSQEITWDELAETAPQMVATMRRYLGQLQVSHRPRTVEAYDVTLRIFAMFLLDNDPGLESVAGISRVHIEAFKQWMATPRNRGGRQSSQNTIRQRLGRLRVFFERVIEWGYDDAPIRVPIFTGDMPPVDAPLPKFLDDAQATRLMRTVAAEPDLQRRLIVELLARTGMRVTELCDLEDNCVIQVGDSPWLRIPVGKLHDDRYVPLHPHLIHLVADYRTVRPPTNSGRLLVRPDGRPLERYYVARVVDRIAKRAGVGHVHPHQLRHTLATQAINRGMSLEAIAALLGHKSLAMTLVYARIADRTLADEYQKISHKIEALYQSGQPLPGNLEGPAMRRIRQQHQRMLGNGWCQRPIELDCAFESICETCTYYHTDIEFRLTLQRQQDHARTHGQEKRATLYTSLLGSLDKEQP